MDSLDSVIANNWRSRPVSGLLLLAVCGVRERERGRKINRSDKKANPPRATVGKTPLVFLIVLT